MTDAQLKIKWEDFHRAVDSLKNEITALNIYKRIISEYLELLSALEQTIKNRIAW